MKSITPSHPLEIFIAYEIGFFQDIDIANWAREYMGSDASHAFDTILFDIAQTAGKSHDSPEPLMRMFIESHWPEFDIAGERSEFYAHQLFCTRLNEYIDGDCKPWTVCRMVVPIENIFDFPEWLGEMFNACDWVDETCVQNDCPHLRSEVEKTLNLPGPKNPGKPLA